MKRIKRIQSFAMAMVMLLSTVVFAGADIQFVSAANIITINFHYNRPDGDYTDWNLWTWTPNADGKATEFSSTDENGYAVATIEVPVGSEKVGYIIRKGEWLAKDYDGDQFLPTGDYINGTIDFYITSKKPGGTVDDTNAETGCVISKVELDKNDLSMIHVTFNQKPDDGINLQDVLYVVDGDGNKLAIDKMTAEPAIEADIKLATPIDKKSATLEGKSYKVVFNDVAYDLAVPDYYSSEEFENEYTYSGNDLGATWSADATTFKVWAPSATAVKVNLYQSGLIGTDDLIKAVDMTAAEKGVWEVTVPENLNGVYYTYEVTLANGTVNEACDPYAKAVGVNGDRAMVIDLDSTDPEGWANDTNPQKDIKSYADCSIWEVQVRDFSYEAESGVSEANRGKYLAFTETGTTNSTGQSTCLDYLKKLGITHVQINPAYDYATVDETRLDLEQYNWGYDPKNYNVPDGSFSSNPYDGAVRINEFKQMVQSLHNAGIGVVMDVVYNHTYNTDYCFNKLVPGYFYRGTNGSGCGNDVASERAMVSKFIVDSVLYWHNEYHIDGFRFDLVGLIDVDTINEITTKLHAIDPSIILYGEGWVNSTTQPTKEGVKLANQSNSELTPGFAYFNDAIRDTLKGNVFTSTDKGYVNGAVGKSGDIFFCAQGAATWTNLESRPLQMINYSSCHDNYTLWDKIACSNPDDSFDLRVKQNNLAAAITFTSQGIPFILAGEEILRTKVKEDGSFDHNSYASPSSENSIKWDTLSIEKYQKVHDYYQGLIAFRNAHSALRMSDGDMVAKCISQIDTSYLNEYVRVDGANTLKVGGVLEYSITGYEGDDDIVVIYNPNNKDLNVNIPDGAWNVYVQGDKAGTDVLSTVAGSVKVNAVSATILVKGSQKNIASKAVISGVSNKTYTGKSIKMTSLKVKYGSKTLKNGKDYTVSYSNNKNAGKAKITVKFKGLYKGTVTKTFTIKKASQSISVKTSLTKKKKDKAFSIGAKLSKGNGKLTYKSSNTKIAKVSSKGKVTLTGKTGTVKITVTAASSNNYNKAAKTVTIKVK